MARENEKAPYSVLIQGGNYLLETEGSLEKCGFYVWRCVEAQNPEEAVSLAIDSIRSAPQVQDARRNAPNDPAQLSVIEIQSGFGDMVPPGSGFIFFKENNSQ